MSNSRADISIVLSGEAGQGIQTLERLIMRMFKRSGRYVFSYSEFMSRIRGGNNSTEIRVSSKRTAAFTDRIDIFVPFGPGAMPRFHDRITARTTVICDPGLADGRCRGAGAGVIEVPLTDMAKGAGGASRLNLVVMGLFAGLFGIDGDAARGQVESHFAKAAGDVRAGNLKALAAGMEAGAELARSGAVPVPAGGSAEAAGEVLMTGAESIALGGMAGGCDFVSSYPMSPSTDVLVNFARHAGDLGIVVEQAEDEISAVNMAIASWYAGGRAMVTTSGGGFALMTEGVSLAGAIESPLVIHIGQRPGPATGMPTRTEQGDLLFALFSGHGEFPRAIVAPGDFTQGFELTRRAFCTADACQVPVIILTDQYYLDSSYQVPAPPFDASTAENRIVETTADYKRYAITESGVSPRGIPGHGSGIVCADSDEHDEAGYITEDFDVRVAQVDKRMRKLRAMAPDILPPDLYGPADCRRLVVSWGSTLNTVREAIEASGMKDIALLHVTQLYPLHGDVEKHLRRAPVTAVIEQNRTAQFGMLVRMLTGIEFDRTILKYSGMPFGVEEIAEELRKLP